MDITVGTPMRILSGAKTVAHPVVVTDVSWETVGDTDYEVISVYQENKDEVYRFDAQTMLPFRLTDAKEIKNKLEPPTLISENDPRVPILDAIKREKTDYENLIRLLAEFRKTPDEWHIDTLIDNLYLYQEEVNRDLKFVAKEGKK